MIFFSILIFDFKGGSRIFQMHFPLQICTFEYFSVYRSFLFLWVPLEPIWFKLIFNFFVFSARPSLYILIVNADSDHEAANKNSLKNLLHSEMHLCFSIKPQPRLQFALLERGGHAGKIMNCLIFSLPPGNLCHPFIQQSVKKYLCNESQLYCS